MLMTWSLGVEEQFYLLFPLLLGWIWNLGRRKILLSLAALSVVSFAVSIFQVSFYPSASFFLLTSRWWELGLGTIVGIYEVSRTEQASGRLAVWRREVLGIVGILGVLAGALLYNSTTPFPGAAALLPVVASLMLLSSNGSWVNRNILSSKITGWCRSYFLFLVPVALAYLESGTVLLRRCPGPSADRLPGRFRLRSCNSQLLLCGAAIPAYAADVPDP